MTGAVDVQSITPEAGYRAVGTLAFSPDGTYLVAGFGTKNLLTSLAPPTPLKVWEVATRKLVRRLDGHHGFCVSLDFSRDGKLLASGSRDGTAILWSTEEWRAVNTLSNPDRDAQTTTSGMVEAVAISPDAKLLALASRGGTVQLWDVASGQLVESLSGHASSVAAVAFSPDGRTLVSSGGDQTVRLWNVESRRELLQLDLGDSEVVAMSLAFSPDGRHLLAGHALWSAAPSIWSDADQAAQRLQELLDSEADFPSRVRMIADNRGLHAALEKLDIKDPRVAAALAATQADWLAGRRAWPEATAAFDELLALEPASAAPWLRTPGLLRVATALFHQNRHREAAALLAGGAERRTADGLPVVGGKGVVGILPASTGNLVTVGGVTAGGPAALAGLRIGDVIEKVNDTNLNPDNVREFNRLIASETGTVTRLTVRRAGSTQSEQLELARELFGEDPTTAEWMRELWAALDERIGRDAMDPSLFELRAELAGQWSDARAQVTDYSAAIDAYAQGPVEGSADHLRRVYARRGQAQVRLRNFTEAVADFAQSITPQTTNENLLLDQATALASTLLDRESAARWTSLRPSVLKSEGGATLTLQPDHSILASGDNPDRDTYLVEAEVSHPISALRIEVLPDPTLPFGGSGRGSLGGFVLTDCRVTIGERAVTWNHAATDVSLPKEFPVESAIDSDPATGWTVHPRTSRHWAVFALSQPLTIEGSGRLTIRLEFQHPELHKHNLGRFRLSVAGDPNAFEQERRQLAVTNRQNPLERLAAAYHFLGDQQSLEALVERHPKLAGPVGDLFLASPSADLARAIDVYSRGLSDAQAETELISKRARAHEQLGQWEAAAADWLRVAEGHPEAGQILARLSKDLVAAGQYSLARQQLDRVEGLLQRSLQKDPHDEQLALDLAQFLLDRFRLDHPVQPAGAKSEGWIALASTEMKSAGGSQFTLLDDNSVLVSGAQAEQDTYTIIAPAPIGSITEMRLETIPHPALPKGGSGRATENGNTALAEFGAEVVPPNEPVEPIKWEAAISEHETQPAKHYDGKHIRANNCLDGDLTTYWETWPKSFDPQFIDFQPAAAIATRAGDRLKIVLRFGPHNQHGLGRFRLSVRGDLTPVERDDPRLVALLKTTTPWLKLAGAYELNGRLEDAATSMDKALRFATDRRDERDQVLEIAALFHETLETLVQRQPDDLLGQLVLARSRARRGRELLTDQPSEALAALTRSVELYTHLRARGPWKVLTPTQMQAQGGELFTVNSDGSIFVSGLRSSRAVYTLRLRTDLPTITALRLETIPDARLPNGGAGRYDNGNFHVAEVTAAIESSSAGATAVPVPFGEVSVDFQVSPQNGGATTLDGDPKTYWDTHHRPTENHFAVFGCKVPTSIQNGFLNLTLDSGITSWGHHGLGRFRLSATGRSESIEQLSHLAMFQDRELIQVLFDLAQAQAATGRRQEAVDSFVKILDMSPDERVMAEVVTEAAAWESVLGKLAARAEAKSWFQAALAQHYVEHGQAALANSCRDLARLGFERQLALNPDDSGAAEGLASVLSESSWLVLRPTEMTSAGGATLTPLDDYSILASGPIPRPDRYSVTVALPGTLSVAAIRLEALAHDSLRDRGPGRGEKGIFALEQWEVTATPPDNSPVPLAFGEVATTYEWKDRPSNVLGQWNISGWHDPNWGGQDHTAVWTLAEPLKFEAGTKLTFQMQFNTKPSWDDQSLGRFRLSVLDRPTSVRAEGCLAAGKASDPWLKLGAAYALRNNDSQAAQYFSQALENRMHSESKGEVLTFAANFDSSLRALERLGPQDQELQLALARHCASQGQAALVADNAVAALSDLSAAQARFAQLLSVASHWTSPTPVRLQSEIGASLERQQDGSVLVRHTEPILNDTYTLEFPTTQPSITALRLEVLPDIRLPKGGSGWGEDGNFQLSELTLHAAPADNPQAVRVIPLRSAWADFSAVPTQTGNTDVRGAVDGDNRTGWSVLGEVDRKHTALFQLAEEVGDGREWRLTVRLAHRYRRGDHNLGRFRLSFSNDAGAISPTKVALQLTDSEWLEATMALAQAYLACGRTQDAAQAIAEALQHVPSPAARNGLVERAIGDDALRAAVLEFRPKEPQLLVGYATWLASRGRWGDAGQAYQQAVQLDAHAVPPWLQAGYWKVGIYPPGLANAYPPESQPDPFQPVAPASPNAQASSEPLAWQPVVPAVDGRIQLGTDRGCNYVLTRVYSPIEQEVALQLGDDDRLRLFWNDRFLLDSRNNGGSGQSRETELSVSLSPGWHTFLAKIENGTGGSFFQLVLSREPQDLLAARVGSRVVQYQELTAAGKPEEAVDLLTELIKEFPRSVRCFVARAEAYAALSKWELAAADWATADLYADKQVKYGSPSYYCLEQRARIFERLGQAEREIAEYTELMQPGRQGRVAWALARRAAAYDRLGKWELARPDHDQGLKLASADHISYVWNRARHFAQQGQWSSAAEDARSLWQTPSNTTENWRVSRDSAFLFAIAGDMSRYQQAAQKLDALRSSGSPDAEQCKWTVLVMLLMPERLTSENRATLLELASKCEESWRLRLTAMVAHRAGDYARASQLLAGAPGSAQISFWRAMNEHLLGNQDLATRLLAEGNAKLSQLQAKAPAAGVPPGSIWQDWAALLLAQYEATQLILGSDAGPPRLFAWRGQPLRAADEYERALSVPDPETKTRLIGELAQFPEVVSILHQRLPAEPAIRDAYLQSAEGVALDFHNRLALLAPESSTYSSDRADLVKDILNRSGVLASLLELRPEDTQLAALHAVRIGDWNNAASHFSTLVEQDPNSNSLEWMVAVALWAFADEPERHALQCDKMYQRFRESTKDYDHERFLKLRLLVDGSLEQIPEDSIHRVSAVNDNDSNRMWFLSALALLRYRQGNPAEAHALLEQSLALEATSRNSALRALALAVRSLIYAGQRETARAQASMADLKQVMSTDLNVKWTADGSVDGTSLLNGSLVAQDALIAEIIRREAERLLAAAASTEPQRP